MSEDDWDARTIPKRKPRISEKRKQGLLFLLIAVGIPLIVAFFQDRGALRFYPSERVFERTLTPRESLEIRAAVDRYKAKLDGIQRAVEDVKERYRGLMGEGYTTERWVVHTVDGFAIPFKYLLALGAVLALIGVAKLML